MATSSPCFIHSIWIHSTLINLSINKFVQRSQKKLSVQEPLSFKCVDYVQFIKRYKTQHLFHVKKKVKKMWFKKNLKYSHSCLGLSRSFFHVDRCLHLHRRPLVLKPNWVHYSFPLRLFLWLFLDLKWWHIQIIKFTSCFRSWGRIFEKDWYVLTLMGDKDSQYSLKVLGVLCLRATLS